MDIQYLTRPGKAKLAYVYSPPSNQGKKYPLVMFCGGYRSDMNGTKAAYFEKQCQDRGQAYLRFDYSGHGQSEGKFEDGTIGAWQDDALDILDHVAKGSVLLVGSSMGGWISLLAAQQRHGKISGLIGIAAAPDFTEELYSRLDNAQIQTLNEKGRVEISNDYSDEPYLFTKNFYEEAKNHLLLDKTKSVEFPMRFIQGMKDKDVPWETAAKIQKIFEDSEMDIVFVDDGDHSLSREQDLELINKEIRSISGYY